MEGHQHNDDCKEVFALLSAYLDQELPPDLCRQIETHISGCAPCVEFVESLRKSIDLCRQYQARDVPGPLPTTARQELMAAYQRMLDARWERR